MAEAEEGIRQVGLARAPLPLNRAGDPPSSIRVKGWRWGGREGGRQEKARAWLHGSEFKSLGSDHLVCPCLSYRLPRLQPLDPTRKLDMNELHDQAVTTGRMPPPPPPMLGRYVRFPCHTPCMCSAYSGTPTSYRMRDPYEYLDINSDVTVDTHTVSLTPAVSSVVPRVAQGAVRPGSTTARMIRRPDASGTRGRPMPKPLQLDDLLRLLSPGMYVCRHRVQRRCRKLVMVPHVYPTRHFKS